MRDAADPALPSHVGERLSAARPGSGAARRDQAGVGIHAQKPKDGGQRVWPLEMPGVEDANIATWQGLAAHWLLQIGAA